MIGNNLFIEAMALGNTWLSIHLLSLIFDLG